MRLGKFVYTNKGLCGIQGTIISVLKASGVQVIGVDVSEDFNSKKPRLKQRASI